MEPIREHVREYQSEHGRIFAMQTGVKDIVYVEGSVLGGWNMLPRHLGEASVLAAELFDAGTKDKTKAEIRDSLAARGATLSFDSGDERTYFRGSCLPEDLHHLLSVIAVCIGEAVFPSAEMKSARSRLHGDLVEEKTNTRTQASQGLARLLYDKDHVNYEESTLERIRDLEAVKRADLLAFRKMIGQGGLVLAIVGDIHAAKALTTARTTFSRLRHGTLVAPAIEMNKRIQEAQTELIPIKNKANIDTFLGASLPLTYHDSLYLPFIVLSEMLGGRGFTSHLMSTIRERDGLTYGVYSTPNGFTGGADGMFRVWATFSPARFHESVEKLRKEINFFFKHGITGAALESRKEEMIGSYLVSLSTTRGIAGMLHQIGRRGKPLSYIDEYPELIQATNLKELVDASRLVPLDKLSLAAAGTFDT